MALFELETPAHIVIAWADSEEGAKAVLRENYPTEEAIRVTKKGGVVFAAYCGNDATMVQYCFGRGMLKLQKYRDLVDPVTFKASSDPAELFELYRKEDIDSLMSAFPVKRLHYVGTDMATNYMRAAIDEMDEEFQLMYLASIIVDSAFNFFKIGIITNENNTVNAKLKNNTFT